MNKLQRKASLENKVKKFFNCGWKLKKLCKEKDYLIVSPEGNAYSAGDIGKEELNSFYDYSTMKERNDAERFCGFLLKNLNLLRTYRKYIEFS